MPYETREEAVEFYASKFSGILNSVLDKIELRGKLSSCVYYEFLVRKAKKEFAAHRIHRRIELHGHNILTDGFIEYRRKEAIRPGHDEYEVTASCGREGLDERIRGYMERNIIKIVSWAEGEKAAEEIQKVQKEGEEGKASEKDGRDETKKEAVERYATPFFRAAYSVLKAFEGCKRLNREQYDRSLKGALLIAGLHDARRPLDNLLHDLFFSRGFIDYRISLGCGGVVKSEITRNSSTTRDVWYAARSYVRKNIRTIVARV